MVVCLFSHFFACYDPLCIYVLPSEGDLDRFLSLLECRLRCIDLLRSFKALLKKTCERTSIYSLTPNNWFYSEVNDKRIWLRLYPLKGTVNSGVSIMIECNSSESAFSTARG